MNSNNYTYVEHVTDIDQYYVKN